MTTERLRAIRQELAKAGRSYAAEEFADLMRGIIAAPTPANTDWTDIVVPDADPALRKALCVLREEWRAEEDGGFTEGAAPNGRLDALRGELSRRGLDGFVVPRTDEFMGEYIPARADRVHWLTGFSGSAGTVVVLKDKAAIFVDGRYTIQVRQQVDTDRFDPRHLMEEPPARWLENNCKEGDVIGFDPWLHTRNGAKSLQRAADRAGFTLKSVADNPIDTVWGADQPRPPLAPIVPQDLRYAGEDHTAKAARVAGILQDNKADCAVLTASDSIAWLLNVRGGDVPNCPLPLSFAIVHDDGRVDWCLDRRKLPERTAEALPASVSVHEIEEFADILPALGRDGKSVQADPATAAAAIFDALERTGADIVEAADPCLLPKACKNETEIRGTKAAHRRDGACVTRFLAWVATDAKPGHFTELDVVEKLRELRSADPLFRGNSFDTISGSGPNGAIAHYRVTEASSRVVHDGEILLVDSGGQYLDGTTDITRTMIVGTPTAEMKNRFTLVLKGHIAVATARFPEGVTGSQIDPLARLPLWQQGLDFDHGTGHGVGSYLNVHEGPQRIAKAPNPTALQPGMILSNEPGYYKADHFGIRIENLVVVRKPEELPDGAERPMLEFETITLAPIDRNLIDASLLTQEELGWLNRYHVRVRDEIAPQVDAGTREWLEKATAPIDPVQH